MATLNIWSDPRDGSQRVYISTRFDVDASRLGIAGADGAFFTADSDGITVARFKSSVSGYHGEAVSTFAAMFQIDGLPFADLIARVEAAKGPRGAKFSENVYFRNLTNG